MSPDIIWRTRLYAIYVKYDRLFSRNVTENLDPKSLSRQLFSRRLYDLIVRARSLHGERYAFSRRVI